MKLRPLIILLFISCSSCQLPTKKINGVSFVASRDSITKSHINPVLNVKSNFVALMPFGFIKGVSSPKIAHNTDQQWFGETKNGLLQYAESFQKENIGIMVKPQIWVWNGTFTGKIKMDSEENWIALEESYRAFILTYAHAAESLHAELLCIGTELEEFVINRPRYWRKLIQEIRTVYKGKLTYAANWDEFSRVPFWDVLDYIGIDAYFPLSKEKTPTIAAFEAGWKVHKEEISQLQKQLNRPVLFTEFGYRSVDFTGKKPWDSKRVFDAINLKAQTNALQAIHNQFWGEDWFAGGFIWKWFHTHDHVGGEKNNRFTPQNKPAEQLLKELYAN
ncbi:glycoside hydrolase [Polaribacter sp.]|nr:glycoside hydrolase [Polaribacter sp.]